jgi:exodeoxyribonuclease-1
MLVEWAHLRDADFARLGMDPALAEARAQRLREAAPALAEKLRRVYADRDRFEPGDVDGSLYDGFLQDADRRRFAEVRGTPPEALGSREFGFQDKRLPELLFRYRARNWPDTLTADERTRWDTYRRQRLCEDRGGSELSFDGHRAELAALRTAHAGDGSALALLDQAQAWADALEADLA